MLGFCCDWSHPKRYGKPILGVNRPRYLLPCLQGHPEKRRKKGCLRLASASTPFEKKPLIVLLKSMEQNKLY